jgi:hypothetical protein
VYIPHFQLPFSVFSAVLIALDVGSMETLPAFSVTWKSFLNASSFAKACSAKLLKLAKTRSPEY